ncbi:hypothetical protein CO656_08620 [Sinorhizobium sp. FG01]|nr:hypothetical protein CO656_08620 [Sinorhizobium sp. FG01]PDT53709.1 hypothetical protein CO664_00520 [Sinorhizobium sp. NG07B]
MVGTNSGGRRLGQSLRSFSAPTSPPVILGLDPRIHAQALTKAQNRGRASPDSSSRSIRPSIVGTSA